MLLGSCPFHREGLFKRPPFPTAVRATLSFGFARQPSAQELGLIGTSLFPSTHVDSGSPHPDPGQHCPGHLLRDHMEGRNSTSATRALKFPDGTSAAWYIVTIIGFYGVIFLFRLAINILRKNGKSLEDIYYLNFTSELKKKGFQSKAAKGSALTISNRTVLQPSQASWGTQHGNSGHQAEIQGIP